MPETPSLKNRSATLVSLTALLALALCAAWQESTLDLLIMLVVLAAAREGGTTAERWVSVALGGLCLTLLLRAGANTALDYFYARPLELKYDVYLAPAMWDLVEDTAGTAVAIAVTAGAALLAIGVARLFAVLLRSALNAFPKPSALPLTALLLVTHLSLVPHETATMAVLREVEAAYRVAQGDDEFEAQLALGRSELLTLPSDLGALKRQDVLLLFVESYGRLLWDDPAMRPAFEETLERIAQDAQASGYQVSSRFVRSTTVGGMSWLAHMSAMSGVACWNTPQWERLLASRVRPLADYFRAEGYETVSVMPAMDIDAWPEGRYFGFTRNFWARDLNYHGEKYAWSPMPDQFVLLRLQQEVLAKADGPVFADVSMTSSHAPFSFIPPYHDGPWTTEALYQTLAEEPAARAPFLWTNYDPDFYLKAVTYSLRSAAEFATRHYRREGVVIIMGDHQATRAVHRVDSKAMGHIRHVPMHVLTRDPELHRRLLGDGFVSGMTPSETAAVLPMERLKATMLRAFSAEGGQS